MPKCYTVVKSGGINVMVNCKDYDDGCISVLHEHCLK